MPSMFVVFIMKKYQFMINKHLRECQLNRDCDICTSRFSMAAVGIKPLSYEQLRSLKSLRSMRAGAARTRESLTARAKTF